MDPAIYDELSNAKTRGGAAAVFDQLIDRLTKEKDYPRLFEALTLRARYELGLPLIALTPSSELPGDIQRQLEDRVIDACRRIGQLYLESGEIARAFHYLQMIGETESIRDAIERWQPSDGDDIEPIVEIAVNHAVHPVKGIKLVLDRFGMCQAITSCESLLSSRAGQKTNAECVKLLVRSLHRELVHRLAGEIGNREKTAPAAVSVPLLLKGRDWLFDDDNYHVDTSHLNSVMRMARLLPPRCEELFLVIQLCDYGKRLSERYRYREAPPFEEMYADSAIYFKAMAGQEVEKGLEHFRKKAESVDPAEVGTYPAEVYVELLAATGRVQDSVGAAERLLNDAVGATGGLANPVNELCQRFGRFPEMATMARRRADLLSFAAAIVQQPSKSP